jgi:hypothetical protein
MPKEYEIYILDKYIFLYDSSIKFETYKCESYYGIIFMIDGDGNSIVNPTHGRYDVVHNFVLGDRLLICNQNGWKDIPFHSGTFGFLPKGIEVIEL